MFCSGCGRECASGMKFCPQCGKPLSQPVPPPVQPVYSSPVPSASQPTAAKEEKQPRALWLVFAAVALGVIVLTLYTTGNIFEYYIEYAAIRIVTYALRAMCGVFSILSLCKIKQSKAKLATGIMAGVALLINVTFDYLVLFVTLLSFHQFMN